MMDYPFYIVDQTGCIVPMFWGDQASIIYNLVGPPPCYRLVVNRNDPPTEEQLIDLILKKTKWRVVPYGGDL